MRESFFATQLRLYGPQTGSAVSLADAQAYCQRWARRHKENFAVVSLLLPSRLRPAFFSIYAFCRWADNLADEIDDTDRSLELLDWWENELDAAFSGCPRHLITTALAETVRQFTLPKQPFLDLLSAFRQDRTVNHYQTEQELLDYCRRSANPVGRLILHLGDCATSSNFKLSDEICTGLQLANFCQDMAVDALKRRIYVPKSIYEPFEVDAALLLNAHERVATAGEDQYSRPQTDQRLKRMLRQWVGTTIGYFERGWPLIHQVPSWLATDVELFARGGLAILGAIGRQDYDVWTQRPVVSKGKRLTLMGKAFAGRFLGRAKVAPTAGAIQ